jgi:hypothetical protein
VCGQCFQLKQWQVLGMEEGDSIGNAGGKSHVMVHMSSLVLRVVAAVPSFNLIRGR